MEDATYSILRQLADSWGMLAMLLGFLAIVGWVLIGRGDSYRNTAEMVFRNEDKPKADDPAAPPAPRSARDDSGEEARS